MLQSEWHGCYDDATMKRAGAVSLPPSGSDHKHLLTKGCIMAASQPNHGDAYWQTRRAEIERLYHELGLSQSAVAMKLSISQQGLSKIMRRLGIEARSRVVAGERNGNFKDGTQSRLYRKAVSKKHCAMCGSVEALGIHHTNDDHFDNRPDNLEVLCNSCHMSVTKRQWWDAKKSGLPLPKSNGPVGWCRKAVDRSPPDAP
jgi:hypothetical protein